MKEVNDNYGLKRLIIIGDKGFNTKDNISQIINDGNGFVFSNKIKGKGKSKPKYQDKCYDTSEWIGNYEFKYTIFDDELDVKGLNDPTRKLKIKVLIYYKKNIADLEKQRRNEKIEKAKEYLKNNPGIMKLENSRETKKYFKATSTVGDTGEVADTIKIELDEERIKEEEKLDGFFCIVTSETEYTHEQILSAYGQLGMIEESFRITKSDFENRPMYVSREEHIQGRMLETFVALLMIRLLQYKMKESRLSAQRIIEALNSCNCNMVTKDVVHIERIGGRNSYFYKKYGNDEKKKSILKLVNDVIEDNSENNNELPKELTDQIVSDYIEILKVYKLEEPRMWMRKKDFDAYIKSINFSTIFEKIKRKPGRPKK